jgi:ectoine hydroxylase-related dioxygenase (phytanoyl-CoA dioxygenase family)
MMIQHVERTRDLASANRSGAFWRDLDGALMRFREVGYHVDPGLVPASLCDRVLSAAASLPNATDGTYRPIPMSHRVDPAFLAMMRFSPIVEIVEQLVGGRASGIGGEYFYMRPGTEGFAPHQDNFYIQAPPDAFVSVWTALCDVDAENGALVFFPGTHKLGALEVRNGRKLSDPGQNPGAQAIECIFPDAYAPMDVNLKKGSVVFFHSQLVHRSSGNLSTSRFRHSFLATYIKSGQPFRAGTVQMRAEVDLHSNEPLR